MDVFFIAIGALLVLVVVHEWGHYMACRRVGIRVDAFAFGFGPKLFSWRHDGTDFKLCLFPLGGYVKPAGEERSQCTGDPGEYFSHPPGHRAFVAVMGPVTNIVLAYILLCIVFVVGHKSIRQQHYPAKVGEIRSGFPAETAGLQVGDHILRINGVEIKDWEHMQERIIHSEGALELIIQREDEILRKSLVPRQMTRRDLFGREQTLKMIGITPEQSAMEENVFVEKYGLGGAMKRSALEMAQITALTYKALFQMLTGSISPKELMGPVGAYKMIEIFKKLGLSPLIWFIAVVSLSLAIFNLLPIPVLDGGHLVFYTIEKIRGRALPEKLEEALVRFGLAFFICLGIFVLYADFERIGLIDQLIRLWGSKGD